MLKKRKKIFVIIGICLAFLLVASVIAASDLTSVDAEVNQVVNEVAESPQLAEEVSGYVKDFVEKRGIEPDSINDVKKIDFNDLPKEVNIENVDDTNLAIYEVDYDNPSNPDKGKVFVVTYSLEQLKSQGDLIIAQDKREFLNFGFNGEMAESGFLKSATGVEGSLEKGYVMMRGGSITGLSTNLEILEGTGQLEIVVYKNGEAVQFGNTFAVSSLGMQKDYDVQSKGIVTFEPGDIISVYVKASSGTTWKDVITLLEITTTN